jgi:tripartite-type tricarboxylate transporter receptor subunit TctC
MIGLGRLVEFGGHPMHPTRRRLIGLAAGALALPALSRFAKADAYPDRPITMVVPFPAGGPTDAIARIIAQRMRAVMGQPVVVENTSGAANGSIGVGRLVRAAPDGYTIGIGHWSSNVVNGAIYSLSYDLLRDLEPLAEVTTNPLVLVGKNSLPAKNLQELIQWMKSNPGKALMGTAGVGSPNHVAGALLERLAGVKLQFVHYRGGAPSMQGLLTGEIDLLCPQPPLVLPLVNDGKIRAYTVTARKRISVAPEIPTGEEAGVTGLDLAVWHGLWAPKGTPGPIVAKLNAGIVEALADAAVGKALGNAGQEIAAREQQTPEGFRAFQKAEVEKWWPIVKAANIKAE